MKSNNIFIKRLIVFSLVLLFVVLGFWFWWQDAVSPPDVAYKKPIIFTVSRGESVRNIATKLSQEGLIRSPTAFYILVKLLGLEKNLQAGDFRLNRSMDARSVALGLTHGFLDAWLTTLEGWRTEEIANALTKELDVPTQEFLKYSREGYMFPDTYLIPRDATPAAIAQIFFDNFNKRITTVMKNDVLKQGINFDQALILASVVEREGRTDGDRPVIAGILLKRLKNDWPLQADATIQYALGYQSQEKSWWKKELTDEDKKIRSDFNTYNHTNLPPSPISNPGLSSIKAVIYPQNTDYWFYLHDKEGKVHYAVTLEEHNANIVKYLIP